MNRTLAISSTLALATLAGTALVVLNRTQWWTDARDIRTPARRAPARTVLWQPAIPLLPRKDGSTPPTDEYEPRLSADGTLMVFVRGRPGRNTDLFISRWTPAGWSAAAPLAELNSPHDELGPQFSADGSRLYFYSDRPGTLGGYDLWVSTRTQDADQAGGEHGAGAWGAPVNLGPSVNTAWNEYGPAPTASGDRLVFASNRPRPDEPPASPTTSPETWTATPRERRARHDYDLYAAPLTAASLTPTGPAVPLTALNTGDDEASPAVSPAGDFLYFASDRPGSLGGYDLYRARLNPDFTFQAPENLGDAVNSAHNDLDPALSAAGFRLTFSSDRPARTSAQPSAAAGSGPAPVSSESGPAGLPTYALWTSTSREVYLETSPFSPPNLGAFWPRLLVLLAALVPLLLLAKLLRGEAGWRSRLGRMSLLAQCLVLSLVLHAVLASLLAVWKVGSGIIDALRPGSGSGTRVILSSAPSSSAAGGITTQIRGALTDAALAIPSLTVPERPAPPAPTPTSALAAAPLPTLAAALTAPDVESSCPPRPEVPAVAAPLATPSEAPSLAPSLPAPIAPSLAAGEAELSRPPVAAHSTAPAPAPTLTSASNPTERALPALATPAPTAAAPTDEGASTHRTSRPAPSVPARAPGASEAPLPSALPSARAAAAPAAEPEAGSASIGSLGDTRAPATAGPAARATETPAPLPALAPPTAGTGLQTPPVATPLRRDNLAASPSAAPAAPSPSGRDAGPAVPAPSAPAAAAPIPEESGLGSATPLVGTSAAPAPLASMLSAQTMGSPDGAATTSPALPTAAAPRGGSAAPDGGSALEEAFRRDTPAQAAPPGVPSAPRAPGASGSPDADGLPIPKETFDQRRPESRQQLVERMGGSAETEKAVSLALEWFTRHQSADGRWSSRHFDDGCSHCAGQAEVDADAGMTGLTLLCFLGAGHTHMQDGPYRDSVERALRWFTSRQRSDGDLRGSETMYSQTVATVAICEAYAMTRDPALASPARRAVELVLRRAASAQPDQRDTAVLGWLVFTVESARRAGLDVPRDVFDRAAAWLDKDADPDRDGLYAYGPGKPASAPMTAEALFVQQLLGHDRAEPRMDASARFVARTLPAWNASAPTHHWYYATLALFQHQGEAWQAWNTALKRELLAHQHAQGPQAGSWDPQDEWSRLAGRVYQTAVCTLSLEVYYRYRTAPSPTPAPAAEPR